MCVYVCTKQVVGENDQKQIIQKMFEGEKGMFKVENAETDYSEFGLIILRVDMPLTRLV